MYIWGHIYLTFSFDSPNFFWYAQVGLILITCVKVYQIWPNSFWEESGQAKVDIVTLTFEQNLLTICTTTNSSMHFYQIISEPNNKWQRNSPDKMFQTKYWYLILKSDLQLWANKTFTFEPTRLSDHMHIYI